LPATQVALQKPHPTRKSAVLLGFLTLVVTGLALPSRALGHVTISPASVEAGVAETIAFETPNERAPHATVGLVVEAPPGITFSAAGAPAGWTVDVRSTRATWTGGTIEGTRTTAFPLRVLAETRAGNKPFRAVQRYDDGREVRWTASLTVLPAAGAQAPSQHLDRALAAAAVGLVVIAGSFLFLRRLRHT
jgi:uncharacterized protein YcnI